MPEMSGRPPGAMAASLAAASCHLELSHVEASISPRVAQIRRSAVSSSFSAQKSLGLRIAGCCWIRGMLMASSLQTSHPAIPCTHWATQAPVAARALAGAERLSG